MPLIEYMADNNPFIDLMTSKLEKNSGTDQKPNPKKSVFKKNDNRMLAIE